LPFLAYIPFSPRAESYYGYEGATSWAIPWSHVPEFFLANFVGSRETYWGSNFAKLHSEYLGLPVVALAVLGARDSGRRRFIYWFGGIGLLFLLVSLGGATPFYRLWWSLMPLMKKVRAAGMAFYIPTFVVATLAAFGVQRLERGEGTRHVRVWLVAAGVIALLGLSGVYGSMAESFARAIETAVPQRQAVAAARAGRAAIMVGALGSAVALALVAGLAVARRRNAFAAPIFAIGLALVVGADLWRNATGFWTYTRAHRELFRPDVITQSIPREPVPARVLDAGVYPGDGVALMAFGVPQLLGHHGNELHRFDELMGGKNQWRHLSPRILDLFAVRYVITPAQMGGIPGYRLARDSAPTSAGVLARLYEQERPSPYVRVVPGAVKVPDSLVVPTLVDPRLPDYDRVVFLPQDTPVDPAELQQWPQPSASHATVTAWHPGAMTIALDPAPPATSYVLVAENWYPDWRATVDGRPSAVVRGNHTLIVVPVPAGARSIGLEFRSAEYARGKLVSLTSLALVLLGFVAPAVVRRRRGG
ncbi:MAG: hypothetical protein ACRD08_02250, partial [Acidimicrobiales bacterium]